MKAWDDLVAAALLGSDRAPVPDLPLAGEAPALAQLEGERPARRLLASAALLSLYQRAGARPRPTAPAPPSPAPADSLPPCPPEAAAHLGEILTGEMRPLLEEWLRTLAAAGRALPHRWLPDLLDLALQQPALGPLIAPYLDERGRWLAAQSPAWLGLAGLPDATAAAWATAGLEARLALLNGLRVTHPDHARELVASTWRDDPAGDRAAFLATFATGLGPADEPFLEAALDDRNRKVRVQAADLLASLPGSRLLARMEARLRPLLSCERTLLGILPDQLWVTMPKVWHKEMARDGLVEEEPRWLEQHEWWLLQMLARVPPNVWCRAWRKQPREIVALADACEACRVLVPGLTAAATRHPDQAWSRALLERRGPYYGYPYWKSAVRGGPRPGDRAILMATASQPWFEEMVVDQIAHLRRDNVVYLGLVARSRSLEENIAAQHWLQAAGHLHWQSLIYEHRRPWGEELTRAFLDAMREVAGTQLDSTGLRNLRLDFSTFALYASPALLEEAERPWPNPEPWWLQQTTRFAAILRFRRDMLQALS